MHGSACSRLLALLLVFLLAGFACAQSDRGELIPAPDRAPDAAVLPPRIVQPPIGEPIRPWPIRLFAPSGTIGLPQLAKAAGLIFAGRVTAIARHPATGGQALETVAITFHVENSIRGAMPGEDLTITQWIGLWSGQRYRIGERLLLFLYPPSKLALTSCVSGPMGRFNLDPQGRVLLSAQQLSAFRTDPVLGGKSRVSFRDFALAVQKASEEE
jgi:hypothetical protein